MKVPYSWLKDFVDLSKISLAEFIEEFNCKCFEIESFKKEHPELKGEIVSGKIESIRAHPQADRLQIVKVKTTEKETYQEIVCGAKNIQVGQVVPVALVGSQVIERNSGKTLKIKKSKIRGIESSGMLCSAEELGLEETEEKEEEKSGGGIYLLPEKLKLGVNLIEYLKLKPEIILEIESRSNRGDALCIRGIAGEAASCFRKKLKNNHPGRQILETNIQPLKELKIEVKEKDDCEQIGFLSIDNLKIGESPNWIKKRLKLSGINPKNNIVDLSNYVMLELGQPLHTYDRELLDLKASPFIEVKQTEKEEAFSTLNKEEIKVKQGSLVVKQNGQTIALAGLIGGENSSINDYSRQILVEAGCFNPVSVRKTSRKAGISTESSLRFERGLNPELVEIALRRVAQLLLETSNIEIKDLKLKLLFEGKKTPERILKFHLSEFKRIIGEEIKLDETEEILESLDITILKKSEKLFLVKIPSSRSGDLKREIDLIEEVFRFSKIKSLESKPLDFQSIQDSESTEFNKSLNENRQFLSAQGYSELISNSLTKKSFLIESYDLFPGEPIKMLNPLSEESSFLRNSGIPNLLKASELNLKREEQVRLFEIGKVYALNKESPTSTIDPTIEKKVLTIVLSGKSEVKNWQNKIQRTADFYELKGVIENLPFYSNSQVSFKKVKDSELENRYFHPEASAWIVEKSKTVGLIGKIHPLIAKRYELPNNTFVAELFQDEQEVNRANRANKEKKTKKIKLPNNNPILERDLTADLDLASKKKKEEEEKIYFQFEQLKTLIERELKNLLSCELLEIFEAEENKQALSLRLSFQANEKLDGKAISKEIEALKEKIKGQFSFISFRE